MISPASQPAINPISRNQISIMAMPPAWEMILAAVEYQEEQVPVRRQSTRAGQAA
jgi:hypothetical protein